MLSLRGSWIWAAPQAFIEGLYKGCESRPNTSVVRLKLRKDKNNLNLQCNKTGCHLHVALKTIMFF